jgi:hypothetical protein
MQHRAAAAALSLGALLPTTSLRLATTAASAESEHALSEAAAAANSNATATGEDSNNNLSSNFDDATAGDDAAAPFDVTEATLQEVHDLVVAMRTHKQRTVPHEQRRHRFPQAVETSDAYVTVQEWDAGHKLFGEWLDKLEKLLTRDIMRAMVRNAESVDRSPAVVAAAKAQQQLLDQQQQKTKQQTQQQQQEEGDAATTATATATTAIDPESHIGFAKHPLLVSDVMTGPGRLMTCDRDELCRRKPAAFAHVARTRQRLLRGAATFFTHAPYQIQIARPDAAPELLEYARALRDRNTLEGLNDLVLEKFPMTRQLPQLDRQRLVVLVSDAMGYKEDVL